MVKRISVRRLLLRKPANDRWDEGRGEIGSGTPSQNNEQFSVTDLSCSVEHEIRQTQECLQREPEIPVVSLVGIETEVPHHHVGAEPSRPLQESVTHQGEIGTGDFARRQNRYSNVHFCPVHRRVVSPADTHVQHLGIVRHEIPCPIRVMGIRVQDGNPTEPPLSPRLADGDDHIVEAAIPSEIVSPCMVAPRPDEAEGIAKLSSTDSIHALHNAPHGGARRGSEWIGLHLGDQTRVVC